VFIWVNLWLKRSIFPHEPSFSQKIFVHTFLMLSYLHGPLKKSLRQMRNIQFSTPYIIERRDVVLVGDPPRQPKPACASRQSMSPDDLPKPRSDSVLKTLVEERQHEIAEFSRSHGVIKTAQWLSCKGVRTSKSAVARFLAWYRSRQTFLRCHTAASNLVAELAMERPELTPERLHEVGHIFFTSLALQKQDQKSWHMNEQITLKKARLHFETRKYEDKLKKHGPTACDSVAPSTK